MESEKLYAALLHLYPSEFREEYGREMRAAFRRRRRDEPNPLRRVFLWLAVFTDTLSTAAREHFDMLMHDIRYSLRTLRKTPAFTVAALTTLALGIGATTAIYTLLHAVLLRPLPFVEPDRVVQIVETNKPLNIQQFSVSYLNFLSWQESSQRFDQLVTLRGAAGTLTGGGEPQRVSGAAVSSGFFALTGLKPVLGRAFLAEENAAGKDGVIMLGEGLWKTRYGGDPGVAWCGFCGDYQLSAPGRPRRHQHGDCAGRTHGGRPGTGRSSGVALGERGLSTLLTAFACLALLLGSVGVAGVVAYSVERRTPELALRLALGSTPGQAMRHAARGALTSSVAGLVLGLMGAWGVSQSLSTLLYGVPPHDPATFIAVGAALLAVAVVACWLPARRATRIDPAAALKQE